MRAISERRVPKAPRVRAKVNSQTRGGLSRRPGWEAKEAETGGSQRDGTPERGGRREAVAVQIPAVPAADFARPCQGAHGMLSDNDEP